MNNLISLKNLPKECINSIFSMVDHKNFLTTRNKIMGIAFFQPSTRTRLSFEISMLALGGQIVGFSDMNSSRCYDKYFEETLEDFTRVISEMVDLLVVRHPENNIPSYISSLIKTPVINAGDGTNEHPTQALQDIWLMKKKAGSLKNKIIGFLGDISRNHRSIIFGLRHFEVSKLIFLLPPNISLPQDIEMFLYEQKITYELYLDLADLLKDADFINSFSPSMQALENKKNHIMYPGSCVLKNFIINKKIYEKTKSKAYILNAGPRTYEVATDMDDNPKFLFFEQVKTGILIRKGIISFLLKNH